MAPVRGQRAGAPAGQTGGSPQEQGGKEQGSGLGRTRPRRRRRPADVRLRRRRERPPVQIAGLHRKSARHDAVPQAPPPPPPPVRAGSPASRVAASYKRLAALRVNDDDPPPARRRARSLDDEYDPRRAVPKYRVSERRRENTLRDSFLPERPAPNADDGFMLGLMTAIGCGTIGAAAARRTWQAGR